MTNPPEPPHGDPSPWARQSGQQASPRPGEGPHAPQASPGSPTRQMPAGSQGQQEEPTTRMPGPPGQPPGPPPPSDIEPERSGHHRASFLRDPVALVLVVVTVVALVAAGLIGAELIGRHIADDKVAKATQCVVDDKVSVSFGISPPFLWQHITGNYTNISIQTAGNQIKDAKEMKADLHISDVRLHSSGDSSGKIGALDATLTWPSAGIKETIQNMVPLLGNLVTDVTTNPADGTVELKGAFGLGDVAVKPAVVNGGLSLQVQRVTGLGSIRLPTETIQPALDDFASMLTEKYPLGLRADSVEVTDSGVVARFSARDAVMPSHSQDPCFSGL